MRHEPRDRQPAGVSQDRRRRRSHTRDRAVSPGARSPRLARTGSAPAVQAQRVDRNSTRRHGHHLDRPLRDGAGRAHRDADDRGRGARGRLDAGARGAGGRRPGVRRSVHRRQPQRPLGLRAAAEGRRRRSRDADRRGGAHLERAAQRVPGPERLGGARGDRPLARLRRPGGARRHAPRAGGPAPQADLRVPHSRQADAAPGHPGQGQRRGGLRSRRASAGHGVRRGGALPRVRRARADVRPHAGPRRAGGATRGPNLERRGGGGGGYLGGGFGRRGGPVDYATEAVELAQKIAVPVQVVWTREDDIQNALYRPATYNVLRGGLDARGAPLAWSHRLVGPEGGSFLITRGADELIYPVPHFRLERVIEDPGIPVAPWRGVGPSQNGWVVESFVDELAHAAGKDPYAYRRELVAGQPRLLGVLDLAAQRAGWGTAPPPRGRSRGIALWQFGETFLSQVAEVSVAPDGTVRVHRVVCAADCGILVNPDTVEAQLQGAIVFGLTAALYGEITIERGRVAQSNFSDYRMLALAEMPEIEVHLVPSEAPPSGVGEAGLPPIAPAVGNAIFAGTGKRIRRLPIGRVV